MVISSMKASYSATAEAERLLPLRVHTHVVTESAPKAVLPARPYEQDKRAK